MQIIADVEFIGECECVLLLILFFILLLLLFFRLVVAAVAAAVADDATHPEISKGIRSLWTSTSTISSHCCVREIRVLYCCSAECME